MRETDLRTKVLSILSHETSLDKTTIQVGSQLIVDASLKQHPFAFKVLIGDHGVGDEVEHLCAAMVGKLT